MMVMVKKIILEQRLARELDLTLLGGQELVSPNHIH